LFFTNSVAIDCRIMVAIWMMVAIRMMLTIQMMTAI